MPDSIYRDPAGEAEIMALYGEELTALGAECGSLKVGTRYGDTHLLRVGREDAPVVLFLPGGNFLTPTCLRWFLRLTERNLVYAPDLIGQPGKSAPTRPSPEGDGHALWISDVLDGLGLQSVPIVGLSYGAAVAIRFMGYAPGRVSLAALVSPAGVATGGIPRVLFRVALPMLVYRARPSRERLVRAARPILTEPEDHVVRELGAIYRNVRLDSALPRMATVEELRGFGGPVAVFASEEDLFFPAQKVIPRAREIFPDLVHVECLEGCQHVPSPAALKRVNETILTLLSDAATGVAGGSEDSQRRVN